MVQKNVLVTTMSVLDKNNLRAHCYYYSEGEDKLYCDGISSLEAGTKYFLAKYPIDEIVVIGTRDTGSEDSADLLDIEQLKQFEEKYGSKSYTAYEFYRFRIAVFLLKGQNDSGVSVCDVTEEIVNRDIPFQDCLNRKNITPCEANLKNNIRIRFVPEQLAGHPDIDNISGIVEVLRGNYGDNINLYIDVQGGNRTSSYVRNAALSILSNQNPNQIMVKEIVATNYNRENAAHQIVEETKRYRILDLASGMNAFIQYGKADMIQKYCEDMEIEKNSSVGNLVEHMSKIDEAISLCDVNSLTETIKELRDFFEKEAVEENTYVGNIFHILQDGIRNDYGKLLEKPKSGEEVDYLELISWCAGKGFIQQALTLIEDKMPEVYIENARVISYQFGGDEEAFMRKLGPAHEKRKANKILYYLESVCLEKQKKGTRKIDEAALLEIKNRMSTAKEGDFAEKYCKFRKWEDAFENGYKFAADLYDNVGKNDREKWKPYFSIVRCCGKKRYAVKKDKNGNEIEVTVEIKLHDKLADKESRRKTDNLFLLQEALKKERNCSNHASDKGIRLSVRTVKRAIEIYVKWAREILNKVS